ncbi:MAG: flagellar basal body P-ring protein FlgI [Planctomycetes bacterium]|nr:flagellar basal body P-ring protein FlgI [Planctomycetota bacterium]
MWTARSRARATGMVVSMTLTLSLLAGAGCQEETKKPVERPAGTMEQAQMRQIALATARRGTIGGVAYPEGGLRLMRVRGYGLVTGLVDKGSRRCPESLRNYLIDAIRRTRMSDPYRRKTGFEPTAAEMIDSPDTAVVLVEAQIPAGAIKGRRFDVRVTAVDEETQSLVGGVLLQTELKVFQSLSPAAILEGRTLAQAGGPIFINPFREATATAAVIHQREGSIIAGGIATEDRKLSLATVTESYATVRQIQDAINTRFKADPPTASADSPRTIGLRVPAAYRGREGRFLELLLHLPLGGGAEVQARAKILAAELSQPDAPHKELALSLEGIGRPAIDFIRPLYAHANRQVNSAAATAGVRLNDAAAIDVIVRHANDPRSPYRYQAIRELGECQTVPRAAAALRELLDGDDAQVRVLAYESLRMVDRRAVAQTIVGERIENFLLEIVPTKGRPMIYVRRTKAPRIALIGGDRMECRPPLLCADAESPVTLTAKDGDQMVAILRKDPARTLGPYYTSLSVPVLTRFLGSDLRTEIGGKLQGLGLDYGSVVAVLYRLCSAGAINADMKWEEPGSDELLGPLQPVGRPESEL